MPFEPLQTTPTTPTQPTTQTSGFVPLEAFQQAPAGDDKERLAKHVGRTAAEAVVPTAAGFAGFGAGMTAAAPIATAVGAVSGPFAPITAGAVELAGGLGGAFLASGAAQKVQNWMHEIFAPEDYKQRQKERQEYPMATFATELGVGLVGASPKTIAEVPGKLLTKPIVQRAAGAGLQAGIEAGTELATEGKIDPTKVALSAAAGVAMPGVSKPGEFAMGIGRGAAKAILPKKERVVSDTTPPPEGATQEEKDAFIASMKAKGEKARLTQTAIRNKETGEIELMGPKHDQARKEATKNTHEEGFVDEYGIFHERQDAVDQAKRAGQLPQDWLLENPPGERMGLHSGDLRKAGVKEFELPATDTTTIVEEPTKPITRDDYKKQITDLQNRRDVGIQIERAEAEAAGNKERVAQLDKEATSIEQQLNKLNKDMPSVKFENSTKPTWEELHDHLWGSKTVGEAFDRILAVDGLGATGQRLLLKALNKSNFIRSADLGFSTDLIKYKDISGKEQNDATGLYTPDLHKVDLGKEGDLQTFIHEAVHAGTHQLLTEGKTQAAAKLNELFNKYKQEREAAYEAALEQFKQDKGGTPSLAELREFEKNYQAKEPYGFTDVHEFVAEAFTSRSFQELLSKLNIREQDRGPLLTMWDHFKDVVRQGLNIPDKARSTLDDVLEHGSTVIEESKDFTTTKKPVTDPNVISSTPHRVLASRLSKEIHDQLEREGIPVAHSTRFAFQAFDWIKHALKGEGAMVKGAGAYFSSKDSTDRGYFRAAKNQAWRERTDAFFRTPAGERYNTKLEDYNDKLNDAELYWSEASESLYQAEYDLKHVDSSELSSPEEIEYYRRKAQQDADYWTKQVERAKRDMDFYEDLISQTREEMTQFVGDPRAYTYHATLEVKPEELLDWDSTKQSDLVKKAFENLGVRISDRAPAITDKNIQSIEQELQRFHKVSEPISNYRFLVVERGPDNIFEVSVTDSFKKVLFSTYASSLKEAQKILNKDLGTPRTGEDLYKELSGKLSPVGDIDGHLGDVKASLALAEQGVVGNVHNANWGQETVFRNYVVFNTSRIKQNYVALGSKAKEAPAKVETVEDISKTVDTLDPRSFPDKAAMEDYAATIYHKHGEEAAVKFFEDWRKFTSEQSIPVPSNDKGLSDALHKVNTFATKDTSEHVVAYQQSAQDVVGHLPKEQQKDAWKQIQELLFLEREDSPMHSADLTDQYAKEKFDVSPEALKQARDVLNNIDAENKALLDKARSLGLDVGREFSESQSRHRIFAPREGTRFSQMVKDLLENKTPFGEKVAEEAQASMERKVYQLDDGRVIELHRQAKDTEVPVKKLDGTTTWKKVRKGTEIWEWKDGKKQQVGHTDNLELGLGDTWGRFKIVDGKVPEIEKHSTYRYLHDAEVSARLANMGLRKMVRDAELIENLKKSEYFERVGRGPDTPIKDVPKGWKQPDSIDKIPQLRGWYFDPKTAAIIEDFAKVWDNTLWMKLTNQIVKNLMLNPVPHMFNEVMHLYNARGFTGWVAPNRLWTFANTARQAFRDVGMQTQFYRDIMREGGSVLGADPRNHLFDDLLKSSTEDTYGKSVTGNSMKDLAKKLGTTVGELYNGISKKSQQAMWFTRDVMYVQLIREHMARAEKAGKPMALRDAIAQVERHMPNYRIPPEILGSRMLSKTLQNPNVAMFSRYHYGMVKSLIESLKDLDPRHLKSPEGRKHFREGVDTMLAIGFGMAALYPLMDAIAESIFGEGAKQRRAGPYHLIHAGAEVAKGEKDLSYMLFPVFTFNPMLLATMELALNKNLFTGRPIYHPEDPASDIASDVGTYGAKKIPQASALMSSGGEGWAARQMDIQVKTEQQKKAADKAQRIRERNARVRAKKRLEGTYKP